MANYINYCYSIEKMTMNSADYLYVPYVLTGFWMNMCFSTLVVWVYS